MQVAGPAQTMTLKKTSAEVSNSREGKRCHYGGGSLVLWSADSRAALHARQWGVGEQVVRVARDQANGRRYQSMATLRSYSSSHWEATRELGAGERHYQKAANSFSLLYPPTVQSQPSCQPALVKNVTQIMTFVLNLQRPHISEKQKLGPWCAVLLTWASSQQLSYTSTTALSTPLCSNHWEIHF